MLDRLIPSDDSHTVITEGKSYSIEVIPSNLMTFRVPCKGCQSPARFFVSFDNQGTVAPAQVEEENAAGATESTIKKREVTQQAAMINKDLRIYVSQEEKEPRDGHCEKSFYGDEKNMTVHTHNKQEKTFENNNIYISFKSIKGCSISVKVKFADPKGHRRQKAEKNISDIEGPDYSKNPEADPFRELRKKMKQEKEKLRKFKFKMQQQKSDMLHILAE